MRIAVSGTHNAGKTSLVDALTAALPTYETIDEPYFLLEEEGCAFEAMPDFDDFEHMLDRSIEAVLESPADCIFDRCPLDMLAYLMIHEEAGRLDVDRWSSRLRQATGRIDLVAFVPIEMPDRIVATEPETERLRRSVDEQLRELILDDSWGLGVPAIEVEGTVEARAKRVLRSLGIQGS